MDADHNGGVVSALGPVSVRRMFGGQGTCRRGPIVAVAFEGELPPEADGGLGTGVRGRAAPAPGGGGQAGRDAPPEPAA